MAFNKDFMANMGVSLTSGFVGNPWSYKLKTDTLAVIKAANYFDEFKDQLTIDDYIYVVGSDGEEFLVVVAVSPNVTTKPLTNDAVSSSIIASSAKTTIGGGVIETFGDGRIQAGDLIFAMMQTEGASPVTILAARVNGTGFDIEFSGDPSSDHVFSFIAVRVV